MAKTLRDKRAEAFAAETNGNSTGAELEDATFFAAATIPVEPIAAQPIDQTQETKPQDATPKAPAVTFFDTKRRDPLYGLSTHRPNPTPDPVAVVAKREAQEQRALRGLLHLLDLFAR